MTARNAKPKPPADEPVKDATEDFEPEPIEAALSRLTRDQLVDLAAAVDAELTARPVDPAKEF